MENFLTYAIGEVAGVGIRVKVCERQHRDRVLDALDDLSNGLEQCLVRDALQAAVQDNNSNDGECRKQNPVTTPQREIDMFPRLSRFGAHDALCGDVEYP